MCTYGSFADSNRGVITKKREAKVEKHEDEKLKTERQEKIKVKEMRSIFFAKRIEVISKKTKITFLLAVSSILFR